MEDDDATTESAVVQCSISSSRAAAADPVADSSSTGYTELEKEVFGRLLEKGIPEVVSDPASFGKQLHRHFQRLPMSYAIDVNVDNAEDVLLHRRILDECADPDKRPVFHVRFLHVHCIPGPVVDSQDNTWGSLTATSSRDVGILHLHEIIVSTMDRPKLLSQLSALLSEVGLNIREAHVFSTSDGFSLHIFVVDGWHTEETDGLLQCLKETAAHNHGAFSGGHIGSSSPSKKNKRS
ncbi:hypothetical protein SORBI_3008G135401 [Sorghum bicolor]|uniref:ACT domain-containing protein n=1 Tax=Sorghum bicolor TaxID=4558 RepID=A0A1Z5R6G4_SORBI|nr:hypothetical protein SORBI_3008G135401 [Sorghum bicolor]